jgi:hypothetical protein
MAYPENDEPIRVKTSPFDNFDEYLLGRPNFKCTNDSKESLSFIGCCGEA